MCVARKSTFLAVLNTSLGVPTKKRETHAYWIYRRGAARERSAYSPWQFHVNKCRGREVASRPAKPAAAKSAGAYSRDSRDPPIADTFDVTGDQSARVAVTARAKYSRYISRLVATANYPQSRAGSRRRRTIGLRANGKSVCAVRGVWTAHGTLQKVSVNSTTQGNLLKNRSIQFARNCED